jgi:hypothetical protein
MYSAHPSFELPPDDTRVRRFMDFSKYVAILENRALYFSRYDKLDDPFEGALSEQNIDTHAKGYTAMLFELGTDPQLLDTDLDSYNHMILHHTQKRLLGNFHKERIFLMINFWHMNHHESVAMWDLYVRTGEGIAVQSTIGRLQASFDASPFDIHMGEVRYIDYSQDPVDDSNVFTLLLSKRKSFEHERELRVFCRPHWDSTAEEPTVSVDEAPIGQNVRVELATLIEKIYVAPRTKSWFEDLVRTIGQIYDLEPKDFISSSLSERPLY